MSTLKIDNTGYSLTAVAGLSESEFIELMRKSLSESTAKKHYKLIQKHLKKDDKGV